MKGARRLLVSLQIGSVSLMLQIGSVSLMLNIFSVSLILAYAVILPCISHGAESRPSRTPELVQRVRDACLSSGRIYQPVFIGLDPMNRVSEWMTTLMIQTGVQEGYVDRAASPRSAAAVTRAALQELRREVEVYAGQRGLDEFQKACLAQCVGYQWFKDTPENAPSLGSIEQGEGNCRHSTYLTQYISEGLGLQSEIVDNGASELFQGIGHTFSRIEVEGRSFVMNNNLSSDSQSQLCAVRFSRTWEKHRECPGFSSRHARYFKGYSRAWNHESVPETGRPAPYTGSARSCGESVSFESPRASGVRLQSRDRDSDAEGLSTEVEASPGFGSRPAE